MGTTDRVSFEGSSWSPLGLSRGGGSLLALSTHSDLSVHFKILEYAYRGGSLEFREVFSLMELLREQWYLIPMYLRDGDKCLVTDKYPSLSMCLEGHVAPSFVAWWKQCPEGILVTAWGCLVFVWHLSRCIGVLEVHSCDFLRQPMRSLQLGTNPKSGGPLVSCTSIHGFVTEWSFGLLKNSGGNFSLVSPSCTATRAPVEIVAISTEVCLSTCPSENGCFQYAAFRTLKSVQIARRSTLSLEDAIAHLLRSAQSHHPLMDVQALIGSLYKCRSGGHLEKLDERNPLESVIKRFTPVETSWDIHSLDHRSQLALAFGLHHLHSRIDPLAASNPSARRLEKQHLLTLLGSPVRSQFFCPICLEPAGILDWAFRKIGCKDQTHTFPVYIESMKAVTDSAVACSFCQLVFPTSPIRVCTFCRIGVVADLV